MNFTSLTSVQLICLCVSLIRKVKNVLVIKEVVKYDSGLFDSDIILYSTYLKMGRPLPSLKEGPSVMLFYLLEIFQSN